MKIITKNFYLKWLILASAVIVCFLAAWLRLDHLAALPPAPYWEEAALGYDAYSLVLTGKDHHGNSWPIAAFESFGDWKPSGYFYAAALSIKTFGLSVWAVRLPTAIAGCFFVVLLSLSGKLSRKFWNIGSDQIWLILLAVAAISPWAILFSRAAWEVMLATTFFLGGLLAWWWSLKSWEQQSQKVFLATFLSLILAVASMYTYHALRLITPLMYLWTFIWWFIQQNKEIAWKNFTKHAKSTIALGLCSLILGIGLLLPILKNLSSPVIQQRFAETSILSTEWPIEKSNAARAIAGNTFFAKVLYHRYWFESQLIAEQFLKHLSLDFLFVHGDSNPRHSVQYFGQLYYLDAVFIIIGAVFLWKNHRNWAIYLLGWWFIATLPAALTTAAPHALRSLAALPVWLWLISYGIAVCSKKFPLMVPAIVGGYLFSLSWFWSAYSLQYPKVYAAEWQTGYCEMYDALVGAMGRNPQLPVYVTRVQGRPAMYYWFCEHVDPAQVQAEEPRAQKDQSEFLSFKQMKFITGVSEVPAVPALVATDTQETKPSPHAALLYSSNSWKIWQQ